MCRCSVEEEGLIAFTQTIDERDGPVVLDGERIFGLGFVESSDQSSIPFVRMGPSSPYQVVEQE